jgi:hypothetical protein
LGDFLCAIGRGVVDDDEFPIQIAMAYSQHHMSFARGVSPGVILFGKGPVQQPGDDGKIASLIVGRQQHRVLVTNSHIGGFDSCCV